MTREHISTSDSIPTAWDYEFDVVVVGGGNAGLPAAISAHDAGVSTAIIEENEFLGGLMRASGGFMFFAKTHVQQRAGIHDEVEWGIEDEMRMSEYRANPEIVEAYVKAGAETVRWLEDLGLVWSDSLRDGEFGVGRNGERAVARTHFAAVSPTGFYPGGHPEGQNGFALTTVLEKAVIAREIPVLFRHRMLRIFREPGGAVVGIRAQTTNGSVTIRARRAVVLASGGATTNEALVKAWDPRYVNDAIHSDGLPYMRAMGDAYIAGLEIGAGLSDMSFVSYLPIRYGSHYYSLAMSAIAGEPGIAPVQGVPIPARRGGYQRVALLRGNGLRYIDESIAARDNPDLVRDVSGQPYAEYPEEPFLRRFLELPNPKNVWAVTDAVQAAAMRWPFPEFSDPQPLRGRSLHPDSVAVAETLDELATQMGMDPTVVAMTIGRYNRGAEGGRDEEFGKTDYPALTQGPFYAARMNLIRHTPSGGLRVNARAQVLEHSALWDGEVARPLADERVIEHLYSAGEASAFVGFRRAHRKTGPILTMGRIAGLAAAAEEPR